jgi:hypothetical protein
MLSANQSQQLGVAVRLTGFLSFLLVLALPSLAFAEDYVITIKDHAFSPPVLTVPAGQKIKVKIKNLDPTPSEFESYELNREKVVTANGEVTVFLGPLKPGTYGYFDDFHRDFAKGAIKAE